MLRSIDHFIGGSSFASGERQGEVFDPNQGEVQAQAGREVVGPAHQEDPGHAQAQPSLDPPFGSGERLEDRDAPATHEDAVLPPSADAPEGEG